MEAEENVIIQLKKAPTHVREWGNLSQKSQILTSDRQKCQLQTQVNV